MTRPTNEWHRHVEGLSASEPAGQRTLGPLSIPGTVIVGETLALALASGDNTITVPTGFNDWRRDRPADRRHRGAEVPDELERNGWRFADLAVVSVDSRLCRTGADEHHRQRRVGAVVVPDGLVLVIFGLEPH